jgi:hypothetical protein
MIKSILKISTLVFSIVACAGESEENDPYYLDSAIPASLGGNYKGNCYSVTEDHTGQIGGYSISVDSFLNSELVVNVVPLTKYFQKVSVSGPCLRATDFVVSNLDFKRDSILMVAEETPDTWHDKTEIVWTKSDKKIRVYHLDKANIGVWRKENKGLYYRQ